MFQHFVILNRQGLKRKEIKARCWSGVPILPAAGQAPTSPFKERRSGTIINARHQRNRWAVKETMLVGKCEDDSAYKRFGPALNLMEFMNGIYLNEVHTFDD